MADGKVVDREAVIGDVEHALGRAGERYDEAIAAAKSCRFTGPHGVVDMINDFGAWINDALKKVAEGERRYLIDVSTAGRLRERAFSLTRRIDESVLEALSKNCSCKMR